MLFVQLPSSVVYKNHVDNVKLYNIGHANKLENNNKSNNKLISAQYTLYPESIGIIEKEGGLTKLYGRG